MKVIVLVSGSTGDVLPAIRTGRRLKDLGHEVQILAPPNFEILTRRHSLCFEPFGEDTELKFTKNRKVIDSRSIFSVGAKLKLVRKMISHQFEILDTTREADLVIGAGLQFCGISMAERLKARYVPMIFSPIFYPSSLYPSPLFYNFRMPRKVNQVTWKLYSILLDQFLKNELNEARSRYGLPPLSCVLDNFLGNTVVTTEKHLFDCEGIPGLSNIGTPPPFNESEIPQDLEKFLSDGPPPICFGFGSMPIANPIFLRDSIRNACIRIGIRAIFVAGWSDLGKEMQNSNQFFYTKTVSYPNLFSRVDGTVHHGGSGTMAESLLAGVPQLIVPYLLDQFFHADLIWKKGLGPKPIHPKQLSAKTLQVRLHELVNNPAFRQKARQTAALIGETNFDRNLISVLNCAFANG